MMAVLPSHHYVRLKYCYVTVSFLFRILGPRLQNLVESCVTYIILMNVVVVKCILNVQSSAEGVPHARYCIPCVIYRITRSTVPLCGVCCFTFISLLVSTPVCCTY
jgi:hypothetical protein